MTDTTTADLALTLRRIKALGDENRLRIVMQLAGGERCVCDLTEALGAGQSLLSFHLKTLKDAGLVSDRRAGRWVHYRLDTDALADLEDLLRTLRRSAETALPTNDCCP